MSLSDVSKYALLKNDCRVLHPFASCFGDVVTVFGVARLPEFGSNELAVSCFNQELERVLLPIS